MQNKMTQAVTIREITCWEPRFEEPFGRLLEELGGAGSLDRALFEQMMQRTDCHLLLAECEGEPLGMLTLALYPTLTALRGWVEDVVVDSKARKRGVGRALLRKAIEIAQAQGCKTLSITSSPHRRAAHALYLSEGFQAITTQPFRLYPNQK